MSTLRTLKGSCPRMFPSVAIFGFAWGLPHPLRQGFLSARLLPMFEKLSGVSNYAPALVQDANASIRWICYGANGDSARIADYLCCRKARRVDNG
ncbi:MAG: hypothetical protein ACUVX8_00125 [Candidatus Zipacnadales bacterium]